MLYNSCMDQRLVSLLLKEHLADDVCRSAWCSYLTCVRMGRLRPGLKPGNWNYSRSPASRTLLVCSHLAASFCREGRVLLHCQGVKKSAGIFMEQLDCNFVFFLNNKCNVVKTTATPRVKTGSAGLGAHLGSLNNLL